MARRPLFNLFFIISLFPSTTAYSKHPVLFIIYYLLIIISEMKVALISS